MKSDATQGVFLGASDDALDQGTSVVIAHIDRQGLAPASAVQVEPCNGIEARAFGGSREIALEFVDSLDQFRRDGRKITPKTSRRAPGFLRCRLGRLDAASDEIERSLKPLIEPAAPSDRPQWQATLADQRGEIFYVAAVVSPHPASHPWRPARIPDVTLSQ